MISKQKVNFILVTDKRIASRQME